MDSSFSRRIFFKTSGAAVACIAVPGAAESAPAEAWRTTLSYPHRRVAAVAALKTNVAVPFNYPDETSPCVLIKTGRPVPHGIGPNADIVAFSALCPHMGCPMGYDPSSRSFKCGCHYSQFDPEMGGQMICGQATMDLPQVTLAMGSDGEVFATCVHGLIYGRQANIL